MIKVNLLPVKKRRKKPKPIPGFVVAGVLLLALSIIVTFYVNYFIKAKVKALQAQKAANAQKIKALQAKIKEVKTFEKLNKTFKERKGIIEQLRRNQAVPVRVLNELARTLTDGVWLSSLRISDQNINLSGVGFTNPDVVQYVQSLKHSKMFQDVYLHGTNSASVEGVTVYKFTISMKVKAG
jgi:type IV pilus assembly protein PilN